MIVADQVASENRDMRKWSNLNHTSDEVDLDFLQWYHQKKKGHSATTSIAALIRNVHSLTLDQTIEDLQIAVSNEEQKLKQQICNLLSDLKVLQQEKERAALIPNLNINLLNKQCLPMMAKIWAAANNGDIHSGLELDEIEPELDSSWTGTWSTDF